MIEGNRVVVILPAYRAEKTLERTFHAIPQGIVDHVLLVDDASDDRTVQIAEELGIETLVHERNLGYGGNQKTCYSAALEAGADIVVMLHPDYQYEPRLVTAMSAMVASGVYDVVVGSRILSQDPRAGGMPLHKYYSNRLLTLLQNVLLGTKLSEFHSGYRAFSRRVLERLPLLANSDDFVFDNQMLAQSIALGFQVGEISCPTRYFPDASSINLRRSIVYGLGVIATSVRYRLWKHGLMHPQIFSSDPSSRLVAGYATGQKRLSKNLKAS